MTDSTAKVCLWCKEEFVANYKEGGGRQLYCTPDHQNEHYREREKKKRAEVKDELKRNMWKVATVQRYAKFFELFGKRMICNICGCSYDENIEKHGVPLHPRLREPLQDYRILDPELWLFYCFECYSEILYRKDRTNK